MTDLPETRYVRSDDGTKLAYQVIGDGPLDLVVFHGLALPVDLMWEDPGLVRISKRLGSFSRTVWCEPRGYGASEGDRAEFGVFGEISDADVISVLDAVGSERVVLFGASNAGLRAIHFSATHPERVSALVLVNTWAHYVREIDYPWGLPPPALERFVAAIKEGWGTGADLEFMAPSRVGDDRFRAWYARGQRLGGGPDETAEAIRANSERDLRPLLASIRAPTLVLHREGNRFIKLGAGKYLAEHIPGAKFVVLPGDDHLFFVGDIDTLIDEVEEFLTGARSGADADVVMAAVLFTDIVASTEHQARVGQREWSRLTDLHDSMVRDVLVRHQGREVKTTGDGFLATFDATGRALRCAAEILANTRGIGLHLRAGLHTGDIEVRGSDIAGLAVSISKRVCDMAGSGEVLVTDTVRLPMVASGIDFTDRGEHELKGVPGTWKLFAVKGGQTKR